MSRKRWKGQPKLRPKEEIEMGKGKSCVTRTFTLMPATPAGNMLLYENGLRPLSWRNKPYRARLYSRYQFAGDSSAGTDDVVATCAPVAIRGH